MNRFALVIVALSQLALAEFGGGSSGVGVPGPAAKECTSLGGKVTYGTEAAGTMIVVCTLGSVQVEEWTLYQTLKGECTQAAMKFLTQSKFVFPKPPKKGIIGMANPASVNCERRGGELVSVESGEGIDNFCTFSDDSSIGQWSLFRGRNAKDAETFARIAYQACH